MDHTHSLDQPECAGREEIQRQLQEAREERRRLLQEKQRLIQEKHRQAWELAHLKREVVRVRRLIQQARQGGEVRHTHSHDQPMAECAGCQEIQRLIQERQRQIEENDRIIQQQNREIARLMALIQQVVQGRKDFSSRIMGLQLSSLLIGGRTSDTSGVSGAEFPTGDSKTAGEALTENQEAIDVEKKPFSQCGFEDDGVAWVKRVPLSRKKITEATEEQKAKYRAILEKILAVETIVGRRVCFDPNDLIEIMDAVRKYIESEPMLVEDVPRPITIVGDLFGQIHDLDRIFKFHAKDGKPGYECAKFIFLGNYVDRGRQSLEVITALFILKILYPDNFFLLRGNHEFVEVNGDHGFAQECDDRFNPQAARTVFHMANGTFMYLSVAAIIGGKYFCVHGGISTNGFTLRRLRNLRKPLPQAQYNAIVNDLVWSDPADGLQGTCWNAGRQTSVYFGEDVFAACMDAVDCVVMFRGHSRVNKGCEVTWDRCFTIFSAAACSLQDNKGAFVQVNDDLSVRVLIMPVDPVRLDLERRLDEMNKKKEAECGDGEQNYAPSIADDLGTGTITSFYQ